MDSGGFYSKFASDSVDSDDLIPPGTSPDPSNKPEYGPKSIKSTPKGVENAKKRLRAFSIQKKSSLSPVSVPKPVNTGTATVLIGKLASVKPISVKPAPKPEDPTSEPKKPPKPPKPGANHQYDSHVELQKKTLSEIETMKRKWELVELGIPLGLICPAPNSDQAMPTKAMPPIKSLLDPAKVDEIIRDAKKAKAEGKQYKFDYKNLLPGYDNPFQRKKEEVVEKKRENDNKKGREKHKEGEKYERYDRRHSGYKKSDKSKDRSKDRPKDKPHEERSTKDDAKKDDKKKKGAEPDKIDDKETCKDNDKEIKEAEVNLKDYLVCDSWSLDNEEKSKDSSPKPEEKEKEIQTTPVQKGFIPIGQPKPSILKELKETVVESPKPKMERLQPVIDSFRFEIEDDVLDMFDENISMESFSNPTRLDKYHSPGIKDSSMDDIVDDKFLESVINELKRESMDEDQIEDKGLVEYDVSPKDRESITPELDSRFLNSSRSDYSDGYKSVESVAKSTESGYKSTESYKSKDSSFNSKDSSFKPTDSNYISKSSSYKSIDSSYKSADNSFKSTDSNYKSADSNNYKSKDSTYKSKDSSYKSDDSNYKSTDSSFKSANSSFKSADSSYKSASCSSIEKDFEIDKMASSTVDSLETWSFVLKICQPILFRHDKNRCYKETRCQPKIWYSDNPKICDCVKDRQVVYEELEMCKMDLVDRVYACDQVAEAPCAGAREWYPALAAWGAAGGAVPLSSEWEADDSQQDTPRTTPRRREMCLDQEYQRFMEAVWPEVEPKSETPRSTPVRQLGAKQKADDVLDLEGRKEKKVKISGEGWSQESDVEEKVVKSKKQKLPKEKRKRKRSSSSAVTDSEVEAKKKKLLKKKENKKSKEKAGKQRRLSKKYLKKLKDKQKKKKLIDLDEDSESDDDSEKKKTKKEKKKKQLKQKKKKKNGKKKKSRRKSSSSSSDSSSDTDSEFETKKKKNKEAKKKKKRKQSSSDSTQSEELFDVNILKNIKTERLTDDEKNRLEFSPRKQKHREIIDVKELQNDFVGNNQIQIKKEIIEKVVEKTVVEKAKETTDVGEKAKKITDVSEKIKEADVNEKAKENTVNEKIKEVPEVKQTPKVTAVKPKIDDIFADDFDEEKDVREKVKEVTVVGLKTKEVIDFGQKAKDVTDLGQKIKAVTDFGHKIIPNVVQKFKEVTDREKIKEITHVQDKIETKHVSETIKQIKISENINKTIKIDDKYIVKNIYDLEQDSQSSVIDLRDIIDDIKEPDRTPTPQRKTTPEESNSQCSSQASTISKDIVYEKDDSHLRPSSQNSNYSFQDIIHSQNELYHKEIETSEHVMNYEMYEQMAMEYQSDVATQAVSPGRADSQRIETVVRSRVGEIKCDWRAGDSAPHHPERPSRWGLKPSEVNIVLTGGGDQSPVRAEPPAAVYRIQSIANRTDNSNSGYDEAYLDTYGAADRLQYGDCFAPPVPPAPAVPPATQPAPPSAQPAPPAPPAAPRAPRPHQSSLDDRIDFALRTTVLGEVAKQNEEVPEDKDETDKGTAVTKSGRVMKRVSFADGYKPGQDSDVEEPPVKRKKKPPRVGCPWPCPSSHADHVPLWDALPPPAPPPGSPPPRATRVPPAHLLRPHRPEYGLIPPIHAAQKYDPNTLPTFMPPEPPPGMISF